MGTPSGDIVTAANRTVVVKDGNGRQITIRKMLPLDRMKLAEFVGADNVDNQIYFGYASLAYHVVSIDGDPRPRTSKAALEATVQLLGDEGLVAVGKGIEEHFLDPAASETEVTAAIKN